MRKLIYMLLVVLMGAVAPPARAESLTDMSAMASQDFGTLYVCGAVNNWNFDDASSLSLQDDGTYTIFLPELYGEFVIADSNWMESFRAGPIPYIYGNGTFKVTYGMSYSSFFVQGTLENVTLTLDPTNCQLTISGAATNQAAPDMEVDDEAMWFGCNFMSAPESGVQPSNGMYMDEVSPGVYQVNALLSPDKEVVFSRARGNDWDLVRKYVLLPADGNSILEDGKVYPFVTGGETVSGWTASKDGLYCLTVDVNTNTLRVEEMEMPMYIVGSGITNHAGVTCNFETPNESNRAYYDENFRLEKVGEVYRGEFLFKFNSYNVYEESQFRFCTNLAGWAQESGWLGSNEQDFYCEPILMEPQFLGENNVTYLPTTQNLVANGLGNWAISYTYYAAGASVPEMWMKVEVDPVNKTVSLIPLNDPKYGVFDDWDFIYLLIKEGDKEAAHLYNAVNEGKLKGDVTVPESVEYDGRVYQVLTANGFRGNYTSVTIPASIEELYGTFSGDNLLAINVDPANMWYASDDGVLYSKDKGMLLCFPTGRIGSFEIPSFVRTIDYWAFEGTHLTSIKCPDTVEKIEPRAFSYSQTLTSVELPTNLTSIAGGLFIQSTALKEITIPETVVTINGSAFSGCKSLSHLELPASVEEVGSCAFAACLNLRSISVKATIPPMGIYSPGSEWTADTDSFFFNSSNSWYEPDDVSMITLHVPAGTKEAYAAAPGWRDFSNIVDDMISTGVDDIQMDKETGDDGIEVYNMSGIRLDATTSDRLNSLPAGLYIVNGRKVMVK